MEPRTESRPRGITVVATLMILFGVAEVFAYEGGAIGTLFVIGGLLLLTGRKWAAGLAEVCLAADVAVAIGTAIAVFFGIYIGLKWRFLR